VESAIGVGKRGVEVHAFIQDNTEPENSRQCTGLRDIRGGSFVGCKNNIKLAETFLRNVATLSVVNAHSE
jgi:hypothetical protein